MPREDRFRGLLLRVREIMAQDMELEQRLYAVCDMLHDEMPYYDWIGFYLVDQPKRELALCSYVGEPTEYTRIPFGRGICGQVAEQQVTFVSQDVGKEYNYLAHNPHISSEVVVPLFKEGTFIGELDINSHAPAPFTDYDVSFLEKMCSVISESF